MAWDDVKVDGTDTLTASEWNTHVTDQKTKQTAAEVLTAIATVFTARIKTGTYTGDGTENKAIAHGLGAIPKLVVIITTTAGAGLMAVILGSAPTILTGARLSDSPTAFVVTTMDTTNFYVGDAANYIGSANNNTYTYAWAALY